MRRPGRNHIEKRTVRARAGPETGRPPAPPPADYPRWGWPRPAARTRLFGRGRAGDAMRRLEVALIGAGLIARLHLDAWISAGASVRVYSKDGRAEDLAREFGA